MLHVAHGNSLRHASALKKVPSRFLGNKCFLSSTHHLFDQLPQTGRLAQQSPFSAGKGHIHNAQANMDSFFRLKGSETKPTRFILCNALNSCAKALDLRLGLQVHARLVRGGYEENLILNTALVDFYAKCGAIEDARRVFDKMERHDHVSWTSIITGFSQNGCGMEALLMFKKMLGTDIRPNRFTYVGAISACKVLQEGAFEECTLLHAHVIKIGLCTNSFVLSSLIDFYSKCGKMDRAKLVFDGTGDVDVILVNSIISGYSLNFYNEEALRLFIKMRNCNLCPTDHSLSSILSACGSLAVPQMGKQVHSLIVKMGSESNVFVVTALIDMYSKCGSAGEARHIFDQTIVKNDVLWTSMIMGYAQSGQGTDAIELFELFVTKEGYKPDHICFTAVLTACNHAGLWDEGLRYFNKMRTDYGLIPMLDQYACMVDLYARNGHLIKAKELMEEMPYEPNYVMWSSFLSSCNVHGHVELGKEAAHQLLKLSPSDAAPYVTLASLYGKAGLWKEVAEVRNLMQQNSVRKSAGWSWLEVDKRVHVISASDATHPQATEIYAELEKLNLEMKDVGGDGQICF